MYIIRKLILIVKYCFFVILFKGSCSFIFIYFFFMCFKLVIIFLFVKFWVIIVIKNWFIEFKVFKFFGC